MPEHSTAGADLVGMVPRSLVVTGGGLPVRPDPPSPPSGPPQPSLVSTWLELATWAPAAPGAWKISNQLSLLCTLPACTELAHVSCSLPPWTFLAAVEVYPCLPIVVSLCNCVLSVGMIVNCVLAKPVFGSKGASSAATEYCSECCWSYCNDATQTTEAGVPCTVPQCATAQLLSTAPLSPARG